MINKCTNGECLNTHSISLKDILNAVSNLKTGQKDHIYEIVSNNFLNGTIKFYNYLTKIFNAVLTHGCTDEIFNQSFTIPIVKTKENP